MMGWQVKVYDRVLATTGEPVYDRVLATTGKADFEHWFLFGKTTSREKLINTNLICATIPETGINS